MQAPVPFLVRARNSVTTLLIHLPQYKKPRLYNVYKSKRHVIYYIFSCLIISSTSAAPISSWA